MATDFFVCPHELSADPAKQGTGVCYGAFPLWLSMDGFPSLYYPLDIPGRVWEGAAAAELHLGPPPPTPPPRHQPTGVKITPETSLGATRDHF